MTEPSQQKPFRSLGHEATVGLLKTVDVLDRRFTEVMQSQGLTQTQYNVLRILRGAGRDGICTPEVGARLVRHSPGISRMMDRLERKRWVLRVRSSEDRREVRCYLTKEGNDLVDSPDDAVDEADVNAVLGLSEAEQRQLIGLMDKVRAAQR